MININLHRSSSLCKEPEMMKLIKQAAVVVHWNSRELKAHKHFRARRLKRVSKELL